MSLHSHASYPIPDETKRVARAAFPRGNLYLQVADCLGAIYHDAQFAALFPTRGQPAASPARLALATVLQFAEGLSDRQAADAVRSRIDCPSVRFKPPPSGGQISSPLCRTATIALHILQQWRSYGLSLWQPYGLQH